MQEIIDKHYQRLGKDYDEFLYYSPAFVRMLTSKMVENLQLAPGDVLADIGCGTGMYSLDILEQVPLAQKVIGVDPYPEMLSRIPQDAHITPINEDALAFSSQKHGYNKVLIKETIHHVNRKEEFFANIHDNLPPGGIMLLVHVPPDFKYPLFDAALKRNLTWLMWPVELERLLREAGFRVSRDGLDYQHQLPKEHYFRMVRGAYMSVLTSFSEEELTAGLAEMAERYAHEDTLVFVDHFDYLTAVRE